MIESFRKMFAKRFIIDLWKGLLYASRNFTTYTILRNYCKNVTSIPSLTWTLALHCYLLFFLGWKEMWDALRDLVPFVQFKKRENYLWRRATFSKSWNVTKSNTPPWEFFAFFKLYKWYHIAQSITYIQLSAKIIDSKLRNNTFAQ